MEIWNVFDRPVDIRTTNVCEGWNSSWNKTVGIFRPNFWKVSKNYHKRNCSPVCKYDVRTEGSARL